ncbi:ester cyclase [Actinoallomurus sp. NBC_01490]|jgi:predicted ester cyclase|uniref:ester cyclase n=1 Tax=Actinoallomurus sp. NBC_01490 TaxID=2903557 RepID=UPI002E3255FA|nr:ester cyclase [Actinoallomurus sp. NBC_01490]
MEKLQATAREFYTAIDSQDWNTVERLVTPDFVAQVSDSSPMELPAWRQQLEMFHQGFPDGHHIIDEYVIGANAVVTRCRFQGTHTGVFHEIAPTGRDVSAGVIHIDHFIDGKIARHLGQLNMLGMLSQLRATPERD